MNSMSNRNPLHSKLKGKPVFAKLTDAELDEFLDFVEPSVFRQSDFIIRQGEDGACMYCIAEGECSVSVKVDGCPFTLASIGPGDVFGELAIFDHRPRSASVQAVTDCVLLRVDEGLVQSLAGLYPAAAYKLMVGIVREIGDRLRKTSVRYVDSLVAAPHLD